MYRHYSSEVSLYSGKTRAYLRYKGIPFENALATADVYRSTLVPTIGRPVIPVVQTPEGEYLQDTTVIIDALEERFPEPSVYPEGPVQRLVALLLEVYGDEWLVMPAMHYRWQFPRENLRFILGEFGAMLAPRLPKALQLLAGVPPALAFGQGYIPYFGLSKKMERPIEESYEALLADLNRHFQEHDFLLGGRPSIGDFGLIGPLYAHLYRDPYPGWMMLRQAPHVARWVERMQQPKPGQGQFLANDEIPATLSPILERMFREQLPVLVDTVKRVERWAAENPGQSRVPRRIGSHNYSVGGVSESRMVTPFSQWMFQRPLEQYRSLEGQAKERADALLVRWVESSDRVFLREGSTSGRRMTIFLTCATVEAPALRPASS